GHPYETDEQIQPGPSVVVHRHPRRQHRSYHLRLRVLHRSAPAALVGCAASLLHRHFLHASHWNHHGHHEPDARPKHHYRIRHGLPVSRPPGRQHVL
ncbi:unnamed protein product, partial [Musa textilis]